LSATSTFNFNTITGSNINNIMNKLELFTAATVNLGELVDAEIDISTEGITTNFSIN